MHDYLWLTERQNSLEMGWAMCASLVFHVLLVLILASTSDYYPATGAETRFEVIWATPSAQPPDPPAAQGVSAQGNLPQLQQQTVPPQPTMLPAGGIPGYPPITVAGSAEEFTT